MPILGGTLLARKYSEAIHMTITITFQDGSTLVCTSCRDLTDDGSWLRFWGTGPDGKAAKFNVNLPQPSRPCSSLRRVAFVAFYSVIYP